MVRRTLSDRQSASISREQWGKRRWNSPAATNPCRGIVSLRNMLDGEDAHAG
jgi:hypothetical protein